MCAHNPRARREFAREEAGDAIMHRNTFGTQRPGGPLRNAFDLQLKNPANTNVVEWGGRLLSLWEARARPLSRLMTPSMHCALVPCLHAACVEYKEAACS